MRNLALIFPCAILLAGCASIVSRQEAQLDAAGFRMVPADTPERQAQMTGLPARQFVRGANGDFITYTYADPLVCNCLYVGSDAAYAAYHRMLAQSSASAGVGGAGLNTGPRPGAGINTGGIR